ncbi:MAG: hypothetical protein ACI4V2_00060 [Alloprevotella sp.]
MHNNAFALTGRIVWPVFTQGVVRYAHFALGYDLAGLSGRRVAAQINRNLKHSAFYGLHIPSYTYIYNMRVGRLV